MNKCVIAILLLSFGMLKYGECRFCYKCDTSETEDCYHPSKLFPEGVYPDGDWKHYCEPEWIHQYDGFYLVGQGTCYELSIEGMDVIRGCTDLGSCALLMYQAESRIPYYTFHKPEIRCRTCNGYFCNDEFSGENGGNESKAHVGYYGLLVVVALIIKL